MCTVVDQLLVKVQEKTVCFFEFEALLESREEARYGFMKTAFIAESKWMYVTVLVLRSERIKATLTLM